MQCSAVAVAAVTVAAAADTQQAVPVVAAVQVREAVIFSLNTLTQNGSSTAAQWYLCAIYYTQVLVAHIIHGIATTASSAMISVSSMI